jgi:cytochrome c-type biogenesis protein CcmE
MTSALFANASPYVTVAEAKESKAKNLHVAGTLVPGTLQNYPKEGVVKFSIKDESGATMAVEYKGAEPGNLTTTPKIVAIGGFEGKTFAARDLLVKCPSKYESDKNGGYERVKKDENL